MTLVSDLTDLCISFLFEMLERIMVSILEQWKACRPHSRLRAQLDAGTDEMEENRRVLGAGTSCSALDLIYFSV